MYVYFSLLHANFLPLKVKVFLGLHPIQSAKTTDS